MRVGTLMVVGMVAASAAQAQVVVRQGGPSVAVRMGPGGPPGPMSVSPANYGVTGWRVGDWVRYSVVSTGDMMPITQVRTVSIVGQQDGKYWVESQEEFVGPMTARGAVRKMLIAFGPMREAVGTEGYTMMPDSSVRRETLLRAGAEGGGPESFRFPQGWQQVGDEEVTVAAGTLKARHWRKGDEHLWVSGDVGPVGVVKYQAGQVTIELGSRGTGAKSRIPFGGGQ